MNKKLILSIFVLAGAPVLLSAAGEARLLRFPATAKRLHSPGSTMEIQKCIPCLQRVANHYG